MGRTSVWPKCKVSFPTCITCGRLFATQYRRAACSDDCFRVWRNEVERHRLANLPPEKLEAVHARRRQRKALLRGPRVAERFKPREVFERDDWICGLCHEPVDRELVHPDPMSASLDHVVPLSRGGEHTRANTRCSHLVCNIRRGNRDALPA